MPKLIRILDLIHQPHAGLIVDLRSRNADGKLMYEHQEGQPRLRVLRSVLRVRKNDVDYLRWVWEPQQLLGQSHDCGYSGVSMDIAAAFHLEVHEF